VADAEALEFADGSFDLVYSHGVLHHTPDARAAVREIRRVLAPAGRAVVMLYHRDSYNYRVNIGLLRRAGARLLKTEAGLRLAHRLTGEPLESLREHAARLKEDARQYLSAGEFLSRNTDGAGNPLTRVYTRREARELFGEFARVEFAVHFLNKRWLPVVGPLLPRSVEARLAARWGWHLWVYARKQ
jgi:ubiquinone/menaquinone biosynthesis C-methylase UbiE